MIRILFILIVLSTTLYSQSIEEKKESLRAEENDLDKRLEKELEETNAKLLSLKKYLKESYDEAEILFSNNATEECFEALLEKISKLKSEISQVESEWRELALEDTLDDNHALWHQPETTLGQLVIDYGLSYVYLIPAELSFLPLSVSSQLPIPAQSWDQMLEEILVSQGLGIRQINPYLKQVYSLKENFSNSLSLITNNEKDLDFIPPSTRACYILTTTHLDPQEIYQFFIRFSNPERIRLNMIGKNIFIIGQVQEIKQLLTMHGYIDDNPCGREYKLMTLCRIPPIEAENILLTYFSHDNQAQPTRDLKVLGINSGLPSLFLVGTCEQIKEAEGIIEDIESKMQDPKEKILFCYQCKHSKAEEIAAVLQKVYALMQSNPVQQAEDPYVAPAAASSDQSLTVSPAPIAPIYSASNEVKEASTGGFIVDSKCGCIIMVVEKEALIKIKELLRKLDVPKKMVQIEVLLFEKKVSEEDHFGLNLLKMGSAACNTNLSSLSWNEGASCGQSPGILSFFLSRKSKNSAPAFDVAYNFLLSQEDVQINACPSVTTINQTPAKIALVEEISVNNGVVLEGDSSFIKDSFSRAQYGITIEITPTIHQEEEGERDLRFITLETDITFDTTKPSKVSRPDVTRRNIKNQVRIPDGETVVIGGLRRKTSHDNKDMIPFLGEIPGFGKLFSETNMTDHQTEMFIFLTPKIIDDNPLDLERITKEQLSYRAGDIPEFLQCIEDAKNLEKSQLFEGSLKMLFGRDQE